MKTPIKTSIMICSWKMSVFALLTGAALLIGGCKNDENPSMAQINLEMKATTALSTINTGARTMAEGLTFDTILLGVTDLEFESLGEIEQEAENDSLDGPDNHGESENEDLEYQGAFVVDLISGTSTPDFGLAELQPGLFESLEVKLGPILENGNSIFVSFTYLPDSSSAPVRVEYSDKEEVEIKIEKEGGFNLDLTSLHPILVTLDLDQLFAQVDLSQAVVDNDGVIRINHDSNPDLSEMISHSIEEGMNAGEDKDHDEEIDD